MGIRCAECGQEFDEMFSETQAYGCATNVHQSGGGRFVISHYGSGFDTEKHELIHWTATVGSHICDVCLEQAIADGGAVRDDSYDYSAAATVLSSDECIRMLQRVPDHPCRGA